MKARPALLLAAAAVIICAGPTLGPGCKHESRPARGDSGLAAPASGAFSEETIATSVQGRKIKALIFNPGDQPPFLVFAAIHGNEVEARVLGRKLGQRWKKDPAVLEGTYVIFIPCMNPDSAALDTRANADGVDLNRNFPAGWERREGDGLPFNRLMPLSEPETRALYDLVETTKPSAVISIHSCKDCDGMNNYDGPAEDYAEAMSRVNGYDASAEWLHPTPGSFGTWAGKQKQIPVVTLELPSPLPADADYDKNIQAIEAAILLVLP